MNAEQERKAKLCKDTGLDDAKIIDDPMFNPPAKRFMVKWTCKSTGQKHTMVSAIFRDTDSSKDIEALKRAFADDCYRKFTGQPSRIP